MRLAYAYELCVCDADAAHGRRTLVCSSRKSRIGGRMSAFGGRKSGMVSGRVRDLSPGIIDLLLTFASGTDTKQPRLVKLDYFDKKFLLNLYDP